MPTRRLRFVPLVAIALTIAAAPAHAHDPVLDWNHLLLEAVKADKTAPPKASRTMAMVHVAIWDAAVGIEGGFAPYHVTTEAPAGADVDAAVAQAAHDVLINVYPAQAATFDVALVGSLAQVPDGPGEVTGRAWGGAVAAAILALRADDGATDTVSYTPPEGAGWWEKTPPAFADSLLPQWPGVTPWAMQRGDQFRPPAPPNVRSAAYADAFAETSALGRIDSATRTADQTEIALFWADGGGTETPPGHWNVIASQVLRDRGADLLTQARTLALLNLATADAAIIAWDAKYAYDHWRPISGIQNADLDGNPDTQADPAWTPLLATPSFPAYVSGHSTFSAASAAVLDHLFGEDYSFETTSTGLPATRSFSSFDAAAEEAGQSRIYGGIHWQYDNQAGLAAGRALGDYVYLSLLRPVVAPSLCVADATTLCLNGGRFAATATYASSVGGGVAHALADSDESGRFWFFDAANSELDLKVLDGCGINGHYWIFAAGLTNVEVTIDVLDTETGRSRSYISRQNDAFTPVQDTSAFAACP